MTQGIWSPAFPDEMMGVDAYADDTREDAAPRGQADSLGTALA